MKCVCSMIVECALFNPVNKFGWLNSDKCGMRLIRLNEQKKCHWLTVGSRNTDFKDNDISTIFIRWSEFWNKNLSAEKKNKSISPQILINHAINGIFKPKRKAKNINQWNKNKNHFIYCRKRLGSVQFSAKHKKFFIYNIHGNISALTNTHLTAMNDQRSTKAPF